MATMTYRTASGAISWRNVFITAGLAFFAPYVIRRMMPLIRTGLRNVSAGRIGVAGRDSVRDAADDLDIGGVSGKLNRGVDRMADHLSH